MQPMRDHNADSLLNALHLASPALPIGGFAYSQGFEQAVEDRLITNAEEACVWISDLLLLVMSRQEIPLWQACYEACARKDWKQLFIWNRELIALRETAELRLESLQMGHSLQKIFKHWPLTEVLLTQSVEDQVWSYTAAHAALNAATGVNLEFALSAFLWSWLENQVMAAVKIIPLGQNDGQLLLHRLKPVILQAIRTGLVVAPEEAGSAAIGLAITSSRHESQYSRLFRS